MLKPIFTKKFILIFFIGSLLTIGFSVWLGVQERFSARRVIALADSSADINDIKSFWANGNDAETSRYNQATFLYQEAQYNDAIDLLLTNVGSQEIESEVLEKSRYNLGNSYYRKAEQTEEPQEAIQLLTESLGLYRVIIADQEHAVAMGDRDQIDPDTEHNYLVVRQKIKILRNLLAEQSRETDREKSLYELVKELVAEEKEIKARLSEWRESDNSETTLNVHLRDVLLEKRRLNHEKLRLARTKIQQLMESAGQPLRGQ